MPVETHAKVAQLVEHSTENAGVVGSIPSLGTFCFLEERLKPGEKGLEAFGWCRVERSCNNGNGENAPKPHTTML